MVEWTRVLSPFRHRILGWSGKCLCERATAEAPDLKPV